MNCKLLMGILFLSFMLGCNTMELSSDSHKVSSAETVEDQNPEVPKKISDEERFWSIVTSADLSDDSDEIASLIEGGVDPDIEDENGQTPLAYAVNQGNSNLVEVLLRAGAGEKDAHEGDELLAIAAKAQHYEIVDLLLKSGAHFEIGNEAMLIKAVEEAQSDLIGILLHNGYSPNQILSIKGTETTLLNYALKGEDETLVTLLLNAGANPNFAVEEGDDNALSIAISEGKSADMLARLLAKGGDPNSSIEGELLIHKAIEGNQLELVETLLIYGAYPRLEEERKEVNTLAGANKEIANLLVHYGW
ncbi:ankyrin repeat domain-containing protein [Guptibacillus algicola]|uniref:ankyrin repeat domain-containing protein n=1 Tax=Guptibacillus algicola TaxID=225844 RepID=UPI001CD65D99|nr:ankyrin repeat domain-containing protein [Alkalihalobacillus algicola]MCA0986955.1 ankyrin repeat domain-containing protein [Alkalihalobacillus algicola]